MMKRTGEAFFLLFPDFFIQILNYFILMPFRFMSAKSDTPFCICIYMQTAMKDCALWQ